MKLFTVAATAAVALPLMASDAMAFYGLLCGHHPAAEASGNYNGNENTLGWWKSYGTDIGGTRDEGTDVFSGGANIGIDMADLFPDGVVQFSGLFAEGTNEDWDFRTKMGAFSVGQQDNFGAGGGWAITAGASEYDFTSGGSFTQDIYGRFLAAQVHCWIGNDFKVAGQIGTMDLRDDFNEWNVDFGQLKGDVFLSDNAVAHGTLSYAESDSVSESEAWSIGAGFRVQWDPSLPFAGGLDVLYMDVEDRFQEDDLWTITATVKMFFVSNDSEKVPTLREYHQHSPHIWGAPPGTAFQVR